MCLRLCPCTCPSATFQCVCLCVCPCVCSCVRVCVCVRGVWVSASALFWHFWRAAPVNNGPLFYASTEAGNVVEFPLPLLHLLPFFPTLSLSIVAAYVWLHTKNNGATQAEAGRRNWNYGRVVSSPHFGCGPRPTWHDSTAFSLCLSLPRKNSMKIYVPASVTFLALRASCFRCCYCCFFVNHWRSVPGREWGSWRSSGSASFEFDFMAFTRALRNLCNSLPRTPRAN